jgi:hypothetical protein
MARGLDISEEDLKDLALLCAELEIRNTFHARDFSAFLELANWQLDQEGCDEVLSSLVDEGKLRHIGPGVFARLGAP